MQVFPYDAWVHCCVCTLPSHVFRAVLLVSSFSAAATMLGPIELRKGSCLRSFPDTGTERARGSKYYVRFCVEGFP